MDQAAIAWITDTVVRALDRDPPEPVPLLFLLRRYTATGAPELRVALEPALARALERQADVQAGDERAGWLTLFAEALRLSGDERLHPAALDLMAALRGGWGRTADVERTAVSIEACLVACEIADPRAIVPAAIDELERVIGAAYRVGHGLARDGGADGRRGWLPDHVRAASALLTAHDITGRLPYSMLAEELVQLVRRTNWDDGAGRFAETALDDRASFLINCAAARVLGRLAELHAREDYRAGAVIAAGAAYDEDRSRILSALDGTYRAYGAASAAYGLALTEWLAMR